MKNIVIKFAPLWLLLWVPLALFAQAPHLGRVATFALFTTAGAISNAGTSTIVGDVGTHVGALTGFPPGTLTGSLHVADSVTTLAATNLGTAASSLFALTCDSTLGATLGNGQILTPRVYCITTLATLGGNLILNGLGNPNSVFVIKINGAFAAGVSSKVLLTNSANFNNVYWYVNGAFTAMDSAQFKGTLICNGAINLLLKADVTGRTLSTAGAISMANTNNVMPVVLRTFEAHCTPKQINFEWVTASEKNNQFFTLQSSSDQINWFNLAQIKGAGNSQLTKKYAFQWQNEGANQPAYYRLKQTDFDGQFAYSKILTVAACLEEELQVAIYPNPTSNIVSLSYSLGLNQTGFVSIYDILGQQIFYAKELPNSIDLSAQPNGIYFMHLSNQGKNQIQKIVVNHF